MLLENAIAHSLQRGYYLFREGRINDAFEDFYRDFVTLEGAHQADARLHAGYMAGVCARLLGDLDKAEELLTSVLTECAMLSKGGKLTGALWRELGAVYAALYLIYRTHFGGTSRKMASDNLKKALDCYELSTSLLDDDNGPPVSSEEWCITDSYQHLLEWQVLRDASSDTFAHGRTLSEVDRRQMEAIAQLMLETAFMQLDELCRHGSPDPQYKHYLAPLLINVVRTESLTERLGHARELLRLTARGEDSSSTRLQALIVLAFGDRVYSWFELRKARQSR